MIPNKGRVNGRIEVVAYLPRRGQLPVQRQEPFPWGVVAFAIIVLGVMAWRAVSTARETVRGLRGPPDQAEVQEAPPTSNPVAPPSVRPQVPPVVVGGACYCPVEVEFCDCPVGTVEVHGDPPAIKKTPVHSGLGAKKPRKKVPATPTRLGEPPVSA